MRKIYEEYFHVPEEGQGVVREKVFFARLAISIVCMAVCMIAMGYNAYAYFTVNIESATNVIQAATYSFDVSGVPVPVETGSYRATDSARYKFTLQAGTYDFTLTKSENATANTGYARVDIFHGGTIVQQFYTQQIGGVLDAENQEITSRTIRIKVNTETVVQFVECWGTYACAESNPTTYLNDNEGIQVENSTIAKADISNLAKASASIAPQDSQSQQPAEEQAVPNSSSEDSQQNVALPQQNTEVNNENESSGDESNIEQNSDSKEQGEEGEQSPKENSQTQEDLN